MATEPLSVALATTASPPASGLVSLTAADLAAVPVEVVARLQGARRVLTVCHRDPEADALGSALALALALETLGLTATPVCSDVVPPMYDFMPRIERFRQDPDPDLDYDLIVVGDCGELARVGRVLDDHAELFGRVPIVDIDHHGSNTGFGAVDWIDPGAAATCEMVTLLLARLRVGLDAADGAIATALMAGVVIDTATFQHPNATARTLRVASELRAVGAPLSDISRRLYRTKPNQQLVLFGLVLGRLETALDGRLLWSTLTAEDFAASGASAPMSEGLIDLLAQSETGAVAILFKDQGEQTRLSVRTRDGGVDAIALTGAFGGGGHARAAGATLALPIEVARPMVLAAAERLILERHASERHAGEPHTSGQAR
jgi:phosphoesterase RecJ-like protein